MTDELPRFHRELVRHELANRSLTVTRVERVAPEMIRVTVAGEELAGFTSAGPADHVKVSLPDPETGVIHTRRADGEPTGPVIMRDFTPLPHESGDELDLDFYTHADPGPAASWALAVKPGDAARVAGPRGSRSVPHGAGRYVLIADETALPSVRRWMQLAPAGTPIEVIAMIGGDGAWVADYLAGRAFAPTEPTSNAAEATPATGRVSVSGTVGDAVSIRVIGRSADEALAALAERGPIGDDTYVWAAGEATSLIPIRRHLRREVGLGKEQVAVDGYWRRGAADFDHHAPLDPTDPED